MQTVKSNFTVEALVAKYRNFVKENCPKDPEIMDPIDTYPEAHLLVTLYKRVAGENTDQNILEALSKYTAAFYTNALNEEEMDFLVNHFSKVSTFIFDNFADKYTHCWIDRLSQKVYEIIGTLKEVEAEKTIFIGGAGLCDIGMLFPNCTIKGYSEYGFVEELSGDKEMWALGQIRLFAAGIKSEIKPFYEDTKNSQYMSDVDIAIFDTVDSYSYPLSNGSEHLFRYMKPNSEFLLFLDKQYAAGNSMAGLGKMLVEKKCIYSIVSFEEPNTILRNDTTKTTICVRANKSTSDVVCIKNNATGEQMQLSANMLDPTILWSSYYLTEKPKKGISLSEIVSFLDLRPKKKEDIVFKKTKFNDEKECIEWILSDKEKNILVVTPKNLSTGYEDAELYEAQLKQAGDSMFENFLGLLSKISLPCVFCYGRKDKFVAGYIKELPSEGIVAYRQLVCLVPKKGIDVRYVTALLLTPEVRNQIISICEGEVDAQLFPLIMDKIIVPNHTDLERATFLSEANYHAFASSRKELEQEHKSYIKAVRMRKHALTQSASAIEATFYALNAYRERQNGTISDNERISRIKQTTVKDAFEYLSRATKDLLVKLDHIADVEYTFAKPERINPEEFIENYIQKHENGWVNFKPVVSWTKGHNLADNDIKDLSGEIILHKGEPIHLIMFPKDALKQILDNIVSNAISHGFIDESINDYQLRFSWETDGFDLKICVENNGAPVPSDRSTSSLLEYGVSTSLDSNGHHGIGCNEIDGIMRKYDGKVEIVSSPEDEFKVKYILTFNRTNTLKTL